MYLVIDIGNTFIKIGLFQNDKLKEHFVVKHDRFLTEIQNIIQKNTPKSAVLAAVRKISKGNLESLQKLLPCTILTQQSKFPFVNTYATPQTLGIDRIAVSAAATFDFPNQNVLIIDAGTCITYDFVTDHGKYLGGAIAPGVNSRYKSLHDYTANLPLLEKQIPDHFIGDSTAQSIHSGVVNGITREIDGVIEQYQSHYKKLTVVLTGGDAEFLAKQLKSSIFVRPYFLLEGLYKLSKFNSNDKKI